MDIKEMALIYTGFIFQSQGLSCLYCVNVAQFVDICCIFFIKLHCRKGALTN